MPAISLWEALATGSGHVFSWPGILIPIGGTLLAMLTAFLPGIGGTSIMAIMMMLTISWDTESVLLLFGALTGGATFMGSITAILFNIPGGAPSAAALLDGYPLGEKGYPKTAIACAATASAVGSIIGVILLIALLPTIRPLLLEFGPLERFLLGVWGLTTIVAVPNTSPLKSFTMALLGLLAAMVGSDPVTDQMRWAFGSEDLRNGFGILPALLGFFTLAELIGWQRRFSLGTAPTGTAAAEDSVGEGIRSVFRHPGLTVRSSLLGTLIGMIPGVGGTVAGFVAYGQAVQTAKGDRSNFGKGDIRGLIAPEAAVDAKDGGSLLPAVAFGLPGSEAGVVLVTVLALHGLVPGTPMLTEQLPLTMTLIVALLFSNLLTSVVGVLLTPYLARLTSLRVDRVTLPVLVISLLSLVQINGQLTDLYVAIGFGIAGYYFKRHGWPRVPFVIAFVLGEFIESNLALSLRLAELGRIAPLERPATLIIFFLTALSFGWMYRKTRLALGNTGKDSGDLTLAAGLLGVCIIFAGTAWQGEESYSTLSLLTLGCTALALLSILWRVRTQNDPARPRTRLADVLGIPADQRLPFFALALLPLVTIMLGLEMALGSLVFAWLALRSDRRFSHLLRALVIAAATILASDYLINEISHLILPRGLLWVWLELPENLLTW